MDSPEEQLQCLTKEFVSLQHVLLANWRRANSGSRDLEMLLDFPKRSTVRVNSDEWQAIKHGLGVRFVRTDGMTVDVPIAVNEPSAVDANRLFDFFVSLPSNKHELLPNDRESFYTVFDELVNDGRLIPHTDSLGRPIFSLRKD